MRERTQKKKKKLSTFAWRLGCLVFCAYLCVSLISAQIDIVAKRKQLENLEQQIAVQTAENEELRRLHDDGDEESYMERIAREKLGYAMPGERVYVDMTGG